ncbi:DUF2794 domain-containing protein [Stappia taiwanensis]|uniref:DUF2794 domain-containing protein n=1 Tax=Stappia taiwanensis TaxID=992267 RepID=A0A838XMP2_9HYPH|nr:DUF2794 domain-containing protein [Stappia taiwanensis]MBA4611392.1 DUF2794 domain-containing protein [Stappia taiwanensis]GGF00683.1 hypothetical protein GCM10007285_30330 [Stappia taiwanensis]
MSEFDDESLASRPQAVRSAAIGSGGGSGSAAGSGAAAAPRPVVAFHRRELDQILRLYGRKVASGEWRDYAIDLLKDRAVFSVFRRTSEVPLFRIEKNPKNARRQGAYSVLGAGGVVLKRGTDLAQVLKVFDKKRDLRLVEV